MTNSINRNMISFKEYAEIEESSTKGLQNKASKSGFAYKTLKKYSIEVLPHGELVIDQGQLQHNGVWQELMPSLLRKRKVLN